LIKILFFLYSFGGGGAERTVVNIINNLDRTEFDPILVIGTNKEAPYLEDISNETKIINLQKRKLRYSINSLKKCILEEKPDVMFSTVNPNNIILALAKLISFHDNKLILREANNRTQSGKVSFLNKVMTFVTYNYIADQIVALSEGVKKDLVTNFKIREEKLSVIHNPVEVDYIKEASKEVVDDFDFSNGLKRIISVGRLVEQKDYPTMLKAFQMISKENIQLIILGIGRLENELRKMCIDLKIEDKVFFLGFKKNPYKYISAADMFVCSSRAEGYSTVVTEALILQKPILTTVCAGMDEILDNGKYGMITENTTDGIYNGMKEILGKQDTYKKYLKLAQERSKYFSMERNIVEYEKLFKTGGIQ